MASKRNFLRARDAGSIKTCDATAQFQEPESIYVGNGGDIACEFTSGNQVVFKDVPTGDILPVRPEFVRKTATTATGLIALDSIGSNTPDFVAYYDPSIAANVVTAGGAVSSFDPVGRGVQLTQTDPTRQPSNASTLNGLNFNTYNFDWLESSVAQGIDASNFAVTCVMRGDGGNPANQLTLYNAAKTVFFRINANRPVDDSLDGRTAIDTSGYTYVSGEWIILTYLTTPTYRAFRVNGVEISRDTGQTYTATGALFLGIGNVYDGSGSITNSSMADCALYAGDEDIERIANLEACLEKKYNL